MWIYKKYRQKHRFKNFCYLCLSLVFIFMLKITSLLSVFNMYLLSRTLITLYRNKFLSSGNFYFRRTLSYLCVYVISKFIFIFYELSKVNSRYIIMQHKIVLCPSYTYFSSVLKIGKIFSRARLAKMWYMHLRKYFQFFVIA